MMNYERLDRYVEVDGDVITKFPLGLIEFMTERKGPTDYFEFDIINMRLTRRILGFTVRILLFCGVIEHCSEGIFYTEDDIY